MTIAPLGRDPGLVNLLLSAVTEGALAATEPGKAGVASPSADSVSLRPAPSPETLWSMAQAALRELVTLIPALEHARQEAAPIPLATLSRHVGDAAHALSVGYVGLAGAGPAAPEPELLHSWRAGARQALHAAADTLDRANQLVLAERERQPGNADLGWSVVTLAGAQRQVRLARDRLAIEPNRAALPPSGGAALPGLLRQAFAAAGLLGVLLVLLALAVLAGLLAASAAGLTLAAAVLWRWRVLVAARRLRITLAQLPPSP